MTATDTNRPHTSRRMIMAMTALLLVVAGCSSASDDDTPSLEGTSWEMTAASDGSALRGAQATDMVTAVFSDTAITGSDGCNAYVLPYTTSGETLSLGALVITGRWCVSAETTAQADRYITALLESRRWSRSDDMLELLDGSQNVLVQFRPAEDLPLAGITWWLEGYAGEEGGMVSPLDGTAVSLGFRPDGSLSGIGGCNGYSAPFRTDGAAITIEGVASDDAYCDAPEGVMTQEAAFLALLEGARAWSTTLTGLTLADGTGDVIAEFRFGGRVR